MDRLNILLLGRYGHPNDLGGVAQATKNLVQKCAEYGVNFHIFSIRDSQLISQALMDTAIYDNKNLRLCILPSSEGFSTLKNPNFEAGTEELADRVIDATYNERFGLIHVITAYPNYLTVGEKISEKLGVPYMVSLRGSDVYAHNPEFNYEPDIEWFMRPIKDATLVSVLSDFQQKEITENLQKVGYKGVPIKKIRNGVDTNYFKPLSKIEIPNGAIRVAYTGRIRKFKNIISIVKAVHQTRQLSIDVEFDIYGKPEFDKDSGAFEEIRSYISANSLERFIRMSGQYVPNGSLPEVYRKHNLFIHASVCEGLSNAVIEAMSCGLAVALNYNSGSSDLLDDPSMVFEADYVSGIAKILENMSENPNILAQHGERNRQFALDLHWSKIAKEYIQVYKDIITASNRK